VPRSNECNFTGLLLKKLGPHSSLIDAATGHEFPASQLPDFIVGFASGFLSTGLQKGDRILISCDLTPASSLAYLGAMYAGFVPVLLDERALEISGEALFRKSRAKGMWVANRVGLDWANKKNIPTFTGKFEACPSNLLAPAPCAEGDLAALMPTSGSTGTPCLVMVSHANLLANTEAIVRSQRLGAGERAMLIMPASYCFGASVLHTHLWQGGGVVFDARFMFPDKVLRSINDYSCTTFAGVPAVYNILLRRSNLKSIPLPGLRRFLQAGGALAPDSVQQIRNLVPNAEFFVMYGQTEATARISCLPSDLISQKAGSVGLPLDNLEVRIVDDEGRELPEGQAGETQVRGPSVCSGYFEDPEATRRKFPDGWLKTGDFASRDHEGYLWIKGRTDEFVKMRGIRVSFAEVEAKVAATPGVDECAAAAVQHPEAGEAVVLFVVAAGGENGVVENIRHTLPPQWTCASIRVVAELPKTANGKIARSKLRTMV
jgi:acyl-CoA synthetase (AMP-forming)/AMP-acid ligase II